MTLDIEQIKARAEAATPGPWSYYKTISGDYLIELPADDGAPLAHIHLHQGKDEQGRNAAFIAHARTDIPLLIQEIDRLQAELLSLRVMVDRLAESRAILLARSEWPGEK